MANLVTYGVKGMHCASCVAIIEKKLLGIDGISSAEASMRDSTVRIACDQTPPTPDSLSALFPEGLYTFSETIEAQPRLVEVIRVLGYAAAVIVLFFGLTASGLLPSLSIDRESSFGTFFVFGLFAGVSTCAALVGSLVIVLSAQWIPNSGIASSLGERLKPHLLFNAGRIAAFALAGSLLGLLGESVSISPTFTSAMVLAVSALMLLLSLQMLGFTPLRSMRIALPGSVAHKVSDGIKLNGVLRPFPSGFMTVLLPCGFTMVAEGAAMLSGNPLHGMSVMTFFALGTMPSLLTIGLSGSSFGARPATSRLFTKTAGMLVLFLTIWNLNAQFGFAGKPEKPSTPSMTANPGPVRVISTVYTITRDISPANFEVRSGEKIRFVVEPKDTGSGCMSTIMVPGLWNHPEDLVKGKTIVMEFTPVKPGNYRITCAMGVPRGVITVR